MTTRTWIGGQGNNQANNANNWSPKGKPLAGDSLIVNTSVKAYTMNVMGNALAGDTVEIQNGSYSFTANLSDQAVMNAYEDYFSATPVTFNVSEGSTLNYANSGSPATTINVFGNDTIHLGASGRGTDFVVNLNTGARWTGNFYLLEGGLTVNGGSSTTFNNDGASYLTPYHGGVIATIDANVIGNGSFDLGPPGGGSSKLEFMQSVGSGQTIIDDVLLQIDQPSKFNAAVTLEYQGFAIPAEIDLVGLAHADSYTFQNDMLNIYSGSKIIDTLRLHDATANGFTVENTDNGVAVRAIYVGPFDSAPTAGALPLHVGT